MRSTKLATSAAAAAVVLTALLGGGFYPLPRMIVGCALMLVWIIAAAGTCGRLDRTERILVGLVVWGLVSALWVRSSPLAAKEILTIWITALLLFGISRRGNEENRRRALGLLAIGAAVVAAAVVVEAVFNGLRVGGLFENPNVAVALMVPTLPVGWKVLDRWQGWRWAWSVLLVVGILCTGSRAGLLAAVVAIGCMLPRGRIRLAGLAVGSSMAVGVLIWRFVSQPDVLAWHRISIWWAVVKIWATRPLTGVGPGGLIEAAGTERILHPQEIGHYQFVVTYAESTPFAVLVQLGAVGILVAVLAAGAWVLAALRSEDRGSIPLAACISAAVTLGLFHDFLTIDPVLWWWAVLFGCVGAPNPHVAKKPPSKWRCGTRWSAALVMVWLTAWGVLTPALARWIWQNDQPTSANVIRTLRIEPWLSMAPAARVHFLMVDPNPWAWERAAEALQWAQTAVDVHPGLARAWADLGGVHLRVLYDLGGTDSNVAAADQALVRACELDPKLPWHWLERARLERLKGNLDEANRLTQHALRLEPHTIRGWVFLSHLELEAGNIGASRAAFEEAIERIKRTRGMDLSNYEQELVVVPEHQLQALRSELGIVD